VSQRSAGPTVGYAIRARHVAEPTVGRGHRTVRCTPDSVRCANGSKAANGRLRQIRKEIRTGQCPVVHRTVRWCTGQCPVRQAGSGELAALGKELTAYGYNSLDCPVCTGLSGEPTVGRANGRLRDPRETRGRANGREGAPDSVRCANGSKAPTVGFAK
jgi:hypothetical protein